MCYAPVRVCPLLTYEASYGKFHVTYTNLRIRRSRFFVYIDKIHHLSVYEGMRKQLKWLNSYYANSAHPVRTQYRSQHHQTNTSRKPSSLRAFPAIKRPNALRNHSVIALQKSEKSSKIFENFRTPACLRHPTTHLRPPHSELRGSSPPACLRHSKLKIQRHPKKCNKGYKSKGRKNKTNTNTNTNTKQVRDVVSDTLVGAPTDYTRHRLCRKNHYTIP